MPNLGFSVVKIDNGELIPPSASRWTRRQNRYAPKKFIEDTRKMTAEWMGKIHPSLRLLLLLFCLLKLPVSKVPFVSYFCPQKCLPLCFFSRQFSWALQNSLHFVFVQAGLCAMSLCLRINRYFSQFLLFIPKHCWNQGENSEARFWNICHCLQ